MNKAHGKLMKIGCVLNVKLRQVTNAPYNPLSYGHNDITPGNIESIVFYVRKFNSRLYHFPRVVAELPLLDLIPNF